MNIGRPSSPSTKIFYCGFMVLSTFYILHFNLYTWNYYKHFGGFWIEPNMRSFMALEDVRLAAVVMAGFIILVLSRNKLSPFINKYGVQKYCGLVLILLLGIQIYILYNSDIKIAPLNKLDQKPPRNWETNVTDVINYLNNSEKGNVLSARAPAISFFTNRTNFDIFSPQTFAYTVYPLVLTGNSSTFKEKMTSLDIKYIVIPNQKSPLYFSVMNSEMGAKLLPVIMNREDFDNITLKDFDIYRYHPPVDR